MKEFLMAAMVVAIILLLGSFLSPEVQAEVMPNYYIKQVSTKGAVRHNVTAYPVLSDVSNVAPVAREESTILTTWVSEPVYYLKDVTGSKTTYVKTAVPVRFIVVQAPPVEECQPRGMDAAFNGIRLYINPTPEEPNPCYCLKMSTKNGVDSFSQYQCWKLNTDGTKTCPAN